MSDNPRFGYLASLVPQLKSREVLHVAPVGEIVEGKIVVTHRSPYPIKIRIGVSSGSITEFSPNSYILYDYQLGEGQSYESDFIYYGSGQSLIVWSDTENTNFIIHGQSDVDPTPSGFVSSLKIAQANKKEVLYTVPDGEEVLLNIFASNQGPSQARFRVAISSENQGTNVNTSEYIEYNTDLQPRTSYQRTKIKVRGNQSVVVSSDNTDVSFSAYAKFNYSVVSTDFAIGGELTVGGDTTLNSNLLAKGDVEVEGVALFSDDVTLDSNLSVYGLLRGYNTSGSLTYTISNQTGSISTIGTISTTSVTSSGNLTVGSNKFIVNASNGDVSLSGTLIPSGGIASNLNLLNNKVTNLAEPTAPSDATTRRYVDGKITALSIALG